MQPLTDVSGDAIGPAKIVVRGEFWDSQIYSGILSLFTCDGRFLQMDWKPFISKLEIESTLKVAAQIAFLGNRALYDVGAQLLLRDPNIRHLLTQKFRRLANKKYEWAEKKLPWKSERENKLPFPHNDSDVHYHQLYVGSSKGVHSHKPDGNDRGVLTPSQHSDIPALDLAIKYQTVVYAAGNDGLHEIAEGGSLRGATEERQVSSVPCVRCEWAYSSIIASGFNNNMYVAEFTRSRRERTAGRKLARHFGRLIMDKELFESEKVGDSGITWGARNRLFRYSGGEIEVVSCQSRGQTKTQKKGLRFQSEGNISPSVEMDSAKIVSARVAPFGSVIEMDDGLWVLPTRGEALFLPGEPTNWRVFPRSTDYLNHLHIAYEDRLEILAFTHDYFVDQTTKQAGFTVGAKDDEA